MLIFTAEVLEKLGGTFNTRQLSSIAKVMEMVGMGYDIQKRQEEVVPYTGLMLPPCYQAYMVCLKIEGRSDGTLQMYDFALKKFFGEVNKPLPRITTNDIRLYLYNLQTHVSNATLNHRRIIIHAFFEWAMKEGYVEKNPSSPISPIKCEKKVRKPLTGEEMCIIRDSLTDDRDKAMFAVLFSTGCRVSELLKLNREDVDWVNGRVILYGKGNKQRVSFLNAEAKVFLKRYLDSRDDDNEALFVSLRAPHDRIKKTGIEARMRKLGERAGIDRRLFPHLVRHTTATTALRRGMPVDQIQSMLGHSSLDTTMIYAKTDESGVAYNHSRFVA